MLPAWRRTSPSSKGSALSRHRRRSSAFSISVLPKPPPPNSGLTSRQRPEPTESTEPRLPEILPAGTLIVVSRPPSGTGRIVAPIAAVTGILAPAPAVGPSRRCLSNNGPLLPWGTFAGLPLLFVWIGAEAGACDQLGFGVDLPALGVKPEILHRVSAPARHQVAFCFWGGWGEGDFGGVVLPDGL